jgi:ABC-type nitrate/sulfonate/bicarbonate transport system substrate-binding protein
VSALVSNGIVTSEAVLADNPELVRRVITAYDRGLRDAILYPAEAYTIATKYVENLPLPPVLAQLALWEQTVIGGMTAAPPPTVVGDRLNALLGTAEPASEEMTPRARAAQYREVLPELLIGLAEPVELLQFRVLLNTIALWDADVLGQTTLEAWQATQDILLQTGQLEAPIALEAAFTNAFIPGE